MAIATRKEFVKIWEGRVDDFILLSSSTDDPEMQRRIQEAMQVMRRIVYGVANEAYPEQPTQRKLTYQNYQRSNNQ